jgi:hypothetical protein
LGGYESVAFGICRHKYKDVIIIHLEVTGCVKTQGVFLSIIELGSLSHRKPASAGISHDSCGAQEQEKKGTLLIMWSKKGIICKPH